MKTKVNAVARVAAGSLAVLLSACASTGGEIAPVEERAGDRSAPPPVAQAPMPERAPTRAPSPAVQALLAQALEASRSSNEAAAVSLLERAQRIEPRNALVWNRLALVRLQQAQFAQAESLALKSNLYTESQPELRLRNWRLIAEARRKQGDQAGAQAAERQAQALQGGS